MDSFHVLPFTETLPANAPLQEVQIPVIGNKQCSCNYIPAKDANITQQMICAGQQNKGACQVKTKANCCNMYSPLQKNPFIYLFIYFLQFQPYNVNINFFSFENMLFQSPS